MKHSHFFLLFMTKSKYPVVRHPVDHVFVPVRAGRRESMVLQWVRSECAFSAAYHRRKENRSLPLHNCIPYTRNVCAIEQRGDH